MLVPCYEITVGIFRFRTCTSVSIEQSWKSLGGKCVIELPFLKAQLAKGRNAIKRGDRVSVRLGYDGKFNSEFSGYVTKVFPNIPLRIEAEDEVFRLRKIDVKSDAANTKLSEVVALIKKNLPELEVIVKEGLEMEFVGLRLDYNLADLLKKFNDENGLVSFFKGSKLYIGLPGLLPTTGKKVSFEQGRNVISTNLEYKTKEDKKIRFKVRGIDTKTKKMLELNIGDADEDGELRTLYYINKSEDEMRKAAEAALALMKFEGFEGGFLAFGMPYVESTDVVRFVDLYFPERAGEYEVDGVKVSSGQGGYRREITLGRRLDG